MSNLNQFDNFSIKSPLRYPGGKSNVVKKIASLSPIEFGEFREPLVGGGSLFILLKQLYPHRRFWINDKYPPLFNFWKMCQSNLDDLVEQVLKFRKRFREGKELYNYLWIHYDKFNNIRKASAYFIFNRITFSGTTHSGGYSDESYKKRFTESSIERLKLMKYILPRTRITNYDYKEVVKTKGSNVFYYLDPPYFSAAKSPLYGRNGNLNKIFNHYEFATVMKECKHKWLITYDDCSFIKKLFSFAHTIKSWNLSYGMRNVSTNLKQRGKELFITNYSIKIGVLKNKIHQKSAPRGIF